MNLYGINKVIWQQTNENAVFFYHYILNFETKCLGIRYEKSVIKNYWIPSKYLVLSYKKYRCYVYASLIPLGHQITPNVQKWV